MVRMIIARLSLLTDLPTYFFMNYSNRHWRALGQMIQFFLHLMDIILWHDFKIVHGDQLGVGPHGICIRFFLRGFTIFITLSILFSSSPQNAALILFCCANSSDAFRSKPLFSVRLKRDMCVEFIRYLFGFDSSDNILEIRCRRSCSNAPSAYSS